jgi:hypothetical protein
LALGCVESKWEVSALVKYTVISLSSLVTTPVVYDIKIRRTRLTRILFGMTPKQS